MAKRRSGKSSWAPLLGEPALSGAKGARGGLTKGAETLRCTGAEHRNVKITILLILKARTI